jgi:diguanylate cyclase (GGDEF)-like protein/PAS domain S-box-containing protein
MKIAHSVPGVVYQFRQRVDGSSCFPFASEGICEIYRVNPEDVRKDATKAFLCIHPVDLEKVVESIQTSAQNLTQWHHEYRVKFDDGTVKWLLGNAMPEREADGATLWHGFIMDITARKQMEEEVRQLAFYDTLTKLPNRRLLNDRLSQTIAASKRSKSYGALMFLDLDNFKPLNDTHGHEVGDMLLIEAANRLTHCIREMDTVARFGGDEFVVMLGELGEDKAVSITQAALVAEKIRATLSEPYQFTVSHDGQADATVEHLCTGSIGVVVFNGSEGSQEDMMKWADVAMYEAKEAGRNQIRFYAEKT